VNCTFSVTFSPLLLAPLVFPSLSTRAPLVPTGIVIPSPWQRLNDFILPCPCLPLLMMCLVPSYFDVDYHCMCVCVCVGSGDGRVMCELFRVSKNQMGGWFDTQAPLFHVLSAYFPHDLCTAFLKPLLSNDSAADVISRMLLRLCQNYWHPTKDGFLSPLFLRSDNYCFHVWKRLSLFM